MTNENVNVWINDDDNLSTSLDNESVDTERNGNDK